MTTTRHARKKKKSRIPSVEEVADYHKEFSKLDFTPEYFHDFYQRTHWRLGGYKIYDWQAVFRVWVKCSKDPRLQPASAPNTPEARQQRLLNAETQKMDDIERQIRERDTRLAEQKAQSVSMEEYKRMKAEGRI